MMSIWWFIVVGLSSVVILLLFGRHFSLWLEAYVTGTKVRFISLILMSLRNVSAKEIVRCQVMSIQAGLPRIPSREMEAQYLAGGNVVLITKALIAAHRANIKLDWQTAAAIDLAGRDILEAVQVSVTPKVIDCPAPDAEHGNMLSGVSRDGIQLKVRVRVTVRTNLFQLIGGTTEETIIARVGEGIVSGIGSCDHFQDVLEDPQIISRLVIQKGLDSQSAFEIVSIDIADIDVGANIGAILQINQANADVRVARAEAEKRRAMAVADEQEMIALTRENQAMVVLAEAKIPAAIAEAYQCGNLRYQKSNVRINVDHSASMHRRIGESPLLTEELRN